MESKFTLFAEDKPEKLDKLFEVYKKDPKKARILFLNSGKGSFWKDRLVLFERGDDFEICTFRKTLGISVTNRMYSSEKKMKSIIYKSGKFWFTNNTQGKKIVQLTYNCLSVFFQNWGWSTMLQNKAYEYLVNKFTWIRFIGENLTLKTTAFNTFTKHGLYNLNAALRHVYGAPLPVVKIFLSHYQNSNGSYDMDSDGILNNFKKFKKGVINIENLRMEMLKHPFLVDTLRLGNMLNKKVNCSWSLKRLVAEHDKWSVEVSDVLSELAELKELKIAEVYLDFAKYAKLVPLKTNQALIREGSVQHHCVGSYSNKVDSGDCCIYHVNGFTLELQFCKKWVDGKYTDKKILHIVQFRGHRNINAPEELQSKIQAQIDEFNKDLKDYEPHRKGSHVEELFGDEVEW